MPGLPDALRRSLRERLTVVGSDCRSGLSSAEKESFVWNASSGPLHLWELSGENKRRRLMSV